MRIIIINLIANTIGDSLFETPMFAILKKNYPGCYLAVTASDTSNEMFKNNPYIDEIIHIPELSAIGEDISKFQKTLVYSKVIYELIKYLRKEKFDLAIITQPNFWLSHIIPFLAGIPYSIGYDYPGAHLKFLLGTKVPFADPAAYPDRHFSESNFDLLKPLDVKYTKKDKTILRVVDDEELAAAKALCEKYQIGNTFICFQAGAKWKRKQWAPEKFKELAKLITEKGYKVVLLGSEAEWDLNQTIRGRDSFITGIFGFQGTSNPNIINLSGRATLSELAGLLKLSKMIIGNDSGLIHLASAVGTKSVAIYGTTSLLHSRTMGSGKGVQVFSTEALPNKLYMEDAAECEARMNSVNVEDVFKAAMGLMKE